MNKNYGKFARQVEHCGIWDNILFLKFNINGKNRVRITILYKV